MSFESWQLVDLSKGTTHRLRFKYQLRYFARFMVQSNNKNTNNSEWQIHCVRLCSFRWAFVQISCFYIRSLLSEIAWCPVSFRCFRCWSHCFLHMCKFFLATEWASEWAENGKCQPFNWLKWLYKFVSMNFSAKRLYVCWCAYYAGHCVLNPLKLIATVLFCLAFTKTQP